MNKYFKFKKYDKVTYIDNYRIKDELIVEIFDSSTIKKFEEGGYKVLKVERPTGYEIVWENKEILDEKEKEYLSAVIKPFRDKVTSVVKSAWKNKEYIVIKMCGENDLFFPSFKKNAMYNGMELNKEYTLKELGL